VAVTPNAHTDVPEMAVEPLLREAAAACSTRLSMHSAGSRSRVTDVEAEAYFDRALVVRSQSRKEMPFYLGEMKAPIARSMVKDFIACNSVKPPCLPVSQ